MRSRQFFKFLKIFCLLSTTVATWFIWLAPWQYREGITGPCGCENCAVVIASCSGTEGYVAAFELVWTSCLLRDCCWLHRLPSLANCWPEARGTMSRKKGVFGNTGPEKPEWGPARQMGGVRLCARRPTVQHQVGRELDCAWRLITSMALHNQNPQSENDDAYFDLALKVSRFVLLCFTVWFVRMGLLSQYGCA